MNNQDYYQKHHLEYCRKTAALGSVFLQPLEKHLVPECRILDVGCGSGRDLLWLKKKGFAPTGFERSPGLAAFARKLSDCPVIAGDFTTYDFASISTDAVLMSGSLVHIPPERTAGVLADILKALHGDRHIRKIVYLSLKAGSGTYNDPDGRVFYLWKEGDLRRLLKKMGLNILEFSESPSADGKGKTWLGYVMEYRNR